MDSTAILEIERLAVAANGHDKLNTNTPAVIVDEGRKVTSLEHLQPGRSRYRGAFSTSSITAFAAYVNRHGSDASEGFVDPAKCSACVFLNAGDKASPGHADWTAKLNLIATAPYAAMLAFCKQGPVSQRAMTDFLEDWAPYLVPVYGDEADYTKRAAALAAIREITIKAKSEVKSTERDFGASRSALEDIEAMSAAGLPNYFDFQTEPFADFQIRTFRLRLSVLTGEKPTLALRIVGHEVHVENIAEEFSQKIEQLIDDVTMALGSFAP